MNGHVWCGGLCVLLVCMTACIRSQASECFSDLDCRSDEVCGGGTCEVRSSGQDAGAADASFPDASPDVAPDVAADAPDMPPSDTRPSVCEQDQRSCDGSCVSCPTPSLGRTLECAEGACVESGICKQGYDACELGCCVVPTFPGPIKDDDGSEIAVEQGSVSVTTTAEGIQWVAYVEDGGALGVSRYDGERWRSFSTGRTGCAPVGSITVGDDGAPLVVAFCQSLSVMRLNAATEAFEPLMFQSVHDVSEVEIGFGSDGSAVVAYTNLSSRMVRTVNAWSLADGQVSTREIPDNVTHVDFHIEQNGDIEGQRGVHAVFVEGLEAYYLWTNVASDWVEPQPVATADSERGAAVSFGDAPLVFVSAAESTSSSKLEVYELDRGFNDMSAKTEIAILAGDRIDVLRGVASTSRDVGVVWRTQDDSVGGYELLDVDEWGVLDLSFSCDGLDEADVRAWSRGGVVHLASRDADDRACLEIAR